jgi:hypothetical protein
MFVTFLVTTCLAALAIGVLLVLFRLAGRAIPGFLIPATIGVSILGGVIYLRYSWADTMIERLPEGVEVIQTFRDSSAYEPWTYLWPRATHFIAVDLPTIAAHPGLPGVYLVEMLLIAEGNPTMTVPQALDCERGRRSSLPPDTELNPETLPDELDWQFDREPAYLFDAVCPD